MTQDAKGERQPEETFETSLERLEQIVKRLEEGELDLDQSVRLFEQGIELARRLEARLTEAEMRVEKLLESTGRTEPLALDERGPEAEG